MRLVINGKIYASINGLLVINGKIYASINGRLVINGKIYASINGRLARVGSSRGPGLMSWILLKILNPKPQSLNPKSLIFRPARGDRGR
jgi:hypothetical protein